MVNLLVQARRCGLILWLIFLALPSITLAQCLAPAGLTADELTPSSVRVNWTPVFADSLLIRYREAGSVVYRYYWIVPGSATSCTIDQLLPNTAYQWQIRAFCASTSSPYQSVAAAFTTPSMDVYCVTPNATTTTGITENTATLSWNSDVIADSFEVSYAEYGNLNQTHEVLAGNDHSITLTGLLPSTTYGWFVRSHCNGAMLPFSTMNTFTTVSDSCDKPSSSSLNSSNVSATGATLSWDAVAGAISYNVRYEIPSTGRYKVASSPTNQLALSRLRPNTTYEFSVQTVCATGFSRWTSPSDFTTGVDGLTVTRGPYIQQTSTNSTFIRWRTNLPTDSKVCFGTAANNLNRFAVDSNPTTEHIVQLSGLSPSTTYYYSIGSGSQRLAGDSGYFVRTNPLIGTPGPTHIWIIGDFGLASVGQARVRDAYENFCDVNNRPTDLWIWLGDNAYYSGTDAEYQEEVFDMYPMQLRRFNCWPAPGNHDLVSCDAETETGPYFENFTLPRNGEVGGIPSHTEAYYSFNYANIHFISLESYTSAFRDTAGDMVDWLRRDLQANRQRWTVVYFHHPPYSKGSHDSDNSTELVEMRTNIIPILEDYRVDLVLSGHSHAYERSYLLRGHYGEETTFDIQTMAVDSGSGIYPAAYVKSAPGFLGTVYVVCGVSGQLSSTSSGWPHDAMYVSDNTLFGSMVIDVDGDRMDCRFLTANGSIRDDFSILKSGSQHLSLPDDSLTAQSTELHSTVLESFIYPNPADQEATLLLTLSHAAVVQLEVFDLIGKKVASKHLAEQSQGTNRIPLDVTSLVSGFYLVTVTAGADSRTCRMVVP